MKTYIQKLSRYGAVLVTVIVVLITGAIVANAATALTVPNAAFFSFSLAAGGNSALITLPADQSVHAMGVTTTVGYRGVGQATLLRTLVAPLFIEWVGLESPFGPAITSGFNSTLGTHIVFIDYSHQVDIQVASASQIRVHNGATAARAGNVTLFW